MENETIEVIEPEIVSTEDDGSATNVVGNVAVFALAAVGAVKVAKFAAAKVPWTVTIGRKVKASETPEVPATDDAPVAAE